MFNVVNTILALLIIAGSMWLVGRFLDRRPFADFGLHFDKNWWLDLGFGLLLGALLMVGIFLVELAAGWVSITGTFRTPEPGQSFALAILVPLLLFVGVGIQEELLTRGYMLRNLAEGFNLRPIGPVWAIVIAWVLSSFIFGFFHAFNPNATVISTLYLGLAGMFLGLAYVLTGELAIPIGLHITWNFFQGNVFGFPVSGMRLSGASFITIEQGGPALWTGGSFGPEAGLIGIVALLVGSASILLWVRLRYNRLALHLPLTQAPTLQYEEHSRPHERGPANDEHMVAEN
jgi:hypothetical protein